VVKVVTGLAHTLVWERIEDDHGFGGSGNVLAKHRNRAGLLEPPRGLRQHHSVGSRHTFVCWMDCFACATVFAPISIYGDSSLSETRPRTELTLWCRVTTQGHGESFPFGVARHWTRGRACEAGSDHRCDGQGRFVLVRMRSADRRSKILEAGQGGSPGGATAASARAAHVCVGIQSVVSPVVEATWFPSPIAAGAPVYCDLEEGTC
jgi:hypothetical protein